MTILLGTSSYGRMCRKLGRTENMQRFSKASAGSSNDGEGCWLKMYVYEKPVKLSQTCRSGQSMFGTSNFGTMFNSNVNFGTMLKDYVCRS